MGRVTDDPTPPARRRGVRAAAARAIDDAQLARPRIALTMLVLLCAMILGGSLLPVQIGRASCRERV